MFTALISSSCSLSFSTICFLSSSISFGSTVFSNYALDFFSQENQDTTFESNDILESEADDILDFSEGNPFGTF